jgi:TonB family protein
MLRSYPAAVISLVLTILSGVRLAAQDVTVTPLVWVESENVPEQLPSGIRLKPEFPEDLRRSPDIGWAVLEYRFDENGKVTEVTAFSTQPAYARSVEVADRNRGKIKPARTGPDPVPSFVRTTIIFNPSSAGKKQGDASPRLLNASYVIDREKTRDVMQPEVVWATVSVSVDGKVTELKDLPANRVELVTPVLRTWTFAPARRGGAPIAADVRVPVIIVGRPRLDDRTSAVPPRVISRVEPEYPMAFRMSGWRGEVVVEFTVDEKGSVRDVTVVRSLNPGFNEPAMEAVRRFKFEPGRVNGRPVATRLQQPISFALLGLPDGGEDGMRVVKRGRTDQLPEGLQYDTPPKSAAVVMPVYPYTQMGAKKKGSATVALLIGPDGKVLRTRVSEATEPEFGYSLQAATELFEYSPALKNGQPTIALITFQQDFRREDEQLLAPEDEVALRTEQKHPEKIVNARQLDQSLKPSVTRAPPFPREAKLTAEAGSAVVDVIVDPEGRVRLPRVVSSSEPQFGYAAVQAVSAWVFGAPTSAGKPVYVRARIPFEFKRTTPPPPSHPASP